MRSGDTKHSYAEALSYMNGSHSSLYSRALHNDVSVGDGPHI